MPYVRRQHQRVLHQPPNAADRAGMEAALRALYSGEPMTPDEIAAHEHAAQSVPYRKKQGDLALVLPEPDRT
jgi:hypothetical protein